MAYSASSSVPNFIEERIVEEPTISYKPNCPDEIKPFLGQKFLLLEDGISFYKVYASFCGFDVRLSTLRKSDDVVLHRYVVCNREGQRLDQVHSVDSLVPKQKRKRMSGRASCMARVVFKLSSGGGYEIILFNEFHSHALVDENQKQFLRLNRRMDYTHQSWMLNCRKANIGPMKSFRLFKELVGSYDKIGCSSVDFKNFSRDLRETVVGKDTQVIINDFESRSKSSPGFYFQYCVDDENRLKCLFWADIVSRNNYSLFGDAASFDATYSTNKYNMIFAPITGKDNHNRCVTFGAALLTREDEESYTWVLQKFLHCMSEKRPSLFITDQDPALKNAIQTVLPSPATRHRFCMWHILCKVADKIPFSLRGDEGFSRKFNTLVWSESVEPKQFDISWDEIMKEYDLVGHKWFDKMFELRENWIPAYFRNIPMAGIFRTTSMSECENSFFQKFLCKHGNLIEFFMQFWSALDSQRHSNFEISCNDVKSSPQLVTNLDIEKHAASIYTCSIFKEVQREIVSAMDVCCLVKITPVADTTIYEVDDNVDGTFTLVYNSKVKSITCGCNCFIRKGWLCKHIFCVFKNLRIDTIPDSYQQARWSKNCDSHFNHGGVSEHLSSSSEMAELHRELYRCLGIVNGEPDLIADMLADLKDLRLKYSSNRDEQSIRKGKKQLMTDFYGGYIPDEVTVLSPNPVQSKGSGSRLQSRKEAAIRKASKPKRKCGKCKKMTNHDSRNCPEATTTNL